MSERQRRDDRTIIAAVALIGMGVWLLLGRFEWFPQIQEVVRIISSIAWPLALIGLGVLLYLASTRGTFRGVDIRGKRIYRSRDDRKLGGVLGGLGAYLSIDPTWLRVGVVLLAILGGFWPLLIAYIVMMIIVPEEPLPGVEPPAWPPGAGSSSSESPNWGSTGRETVQTPPPAPPIPPETPKQG